MADAFGDLQEWGAVLATLEQLRDDGCLDEHQAGLARLVRFHNWRLQEAALECALEIDCSSDLLIADVLNALADLETPLDLRVRAAQAAGHLLSCYDPDDPSPFDAGRAYLTLQHMAGQQQPPLLAVALEEALERGRPAAPRGRGLTSGSARPVNRQRRSEGGAECA